ncbi:hypothetical protein [Thauera sp. 63]|jgi:hypothetical protein|uniref:hypothetical protein n=1 Tax=Thauera sp. 63 TaxID=497321 RepID=UPI0002D09A4E|nr:hypothetical protein [Thauera sp. 63]ENO80311.1 hypothetical protein C664_01175 [Thauera sp. 63]
MNTLHLKAKSRGSWTNVCPFPEDEISYVQAGAEGIARAAAGAVSFKITDDKGVTLHSLDPRHGSYAWHARVAS